MMKEYILATHRRVCVDKRDGEFFITIDEPGTYLKSVTLPAKRWAALMLAITPIDESVALLQSQQYVKLFTHFGGGFFISVTTGFRCVDLRRFYFNSTKDSNQPTRDGIALTLSQWSLFKVIVQQINKDFPELSEIEHCTHRELMELFNCKECYPLDILPKPVL
jgi:hypothetical protein